MSSLGRRVASAEARMKIVKPGILAIVLVNDPEGLEMDDGQTAPKRICFRCQPDESVEAFRDRARAEAQRAGEKVILFGGTAA
jgi:hypothetical protein